jgi:hypothetical protein
MRARVEAREGRSAPALFADTGCDEAAFKVIDASLKGKKSAEALQKYPRLAVTSLGLAGKSKR